GHVVERVNATLMNPALQLLGTKRLAPPLCDQIAQFGAAKAKKVYRFGLRHGQLACPRLRRQKLTAVDIAFGEEESDFNGGGFRSIRTMNGVGVDAVCEIGANRAGLGLLGIGGAHQVAVLLNRVFTFEDLNKHRTRNHEFHQILEKGALFVNRIKTLGLGARQLLQASGHHLEACLFKTGDDLSDNVFCNGIGLDNGKSAFNSHKISEE